MPKNNIYFIYKYEWPDGCIYIGQSNTTQNRFGNIEAYRSNPSLYSKMKTEPEFKKDIIEDHLSEKYVSLKEVYWIGYYHAFHEDNKIKGLNFTLYECGAKKHNSKYSDVKINQYDKDGKYLKTYDSIYDCSKDMGVLYNNIYASCTYGTLFNKKYYFRADNGSTDDIDVSIKKRQGRVAKPVIQYTKEGVEIKVWPSMKEAAKELKIAKTHISSCCTGLLKSAGGFVWRYKEGAKK